MECRKQISSKNKANIKKNVFQIQKDYTKKKFLDSNSINLAVKDDPRALKIHLEVIGLRNQLMQKQNSSQLLQTSLNSKVERCKTKKTEKKSSTFVINNNNNNIVSSPNKDITISSICSSLELKNPNNSEISQIPTFKDNNLNNLFYTDFNIFNSELNEFNSKSSMFDQNFNERINVNFNFIFEEDY